MSLYTYKTNVKLNSFPTPFIHYKGITGHSPSLIIEYKDGVLSLRHIDQSFELNMDAHAALDFLSDLASKLTKPEFDNDPPAGDFQYGLMGFFSFEFGLKLLNIKVKQENPGCSDFYFMLPTKFESGKHVYSVTTEKPLRDVPNPELINQKAPSEVKANMSNKQYGKKLEKVRQYLEEGETYQVNFAQEFRTESKKLPLDVFNQLHETNPSPHDAILSTANFSVISNSPECLYKKVGNKISTFPIKGTAKKEDGTEALLASKKEKAELEMIVDLERNDLGRIAKTGTVNVSNHRYIESYKNVHHTVSQIDAELSEETTFAQIIEALFPGGSITGCPKKRTSEIIHKLEPSPRGSYCGSLGMIDINGNSEFNILIRTIWMQGNLASFHSGGGITIQSIADNEYEETLAKAKNLNKVLSE